MLSKKARRAEVYLKSTIFDDLNIEFAPKAMPEVYTAFRQAKRYFKNDEEEQIIELEVR
jgi:hypothetical protein